MVQGKKAFNNSKPKFAEVVIGDSETKKMRVAANSRPSRSPYLKLIHPNGVTLILPADTSVELIEMPIDNTDTERLIRDMVMGKKSYLFCRDLDACRRAAMMYSLFGACKVLGKNPERWLSYVLKNIKTTPKDKLYTLLPEFWEDEG